MGSGFIGLMGSKQLSGFPLHPVLSGFISLFDCDGPTVSKISHWLRKSCRISEWLSECKRVQRVIGRCIPVPVSAGYTKVPRVPDISEPVAGFPGVRMRKGGAGWRLMWAGSGGQWGWDFLLFSLFQFLDKMVCTCDCVGDETFY